MPPQPGTNVTQRRNASKEKDDTCQICRSKVCPMLGGGQMIQCDNDEECGLWQHAVCAGLDHEKIKKIDQYFCLTCREKRGKKITYLEVSPRPRSKTPLTMSSLKLRSMPKGSISATATTRRHHPGNVPQSSSVSPCLEQPVVGNSAMTSDVSRDSTRESSVASQQLCSVGEPTQRSGGATRPTAEMIKDVIGDISSDSSDDEEDDDGGSQRFNGCISFVAEATSADTTNEPMDIENTSGTNFQEDVDNNTENWNDASSDSMGTENADVDMVFTKSRSAPRKGNLVRSRGRPKRIQGATREMPSRAIMTVTKNPRVARPKEASKKSSRTASKNRNSKRHREGAKNENGAKSAGSHHGPVSSAARSHSLFADVGEDRKTKQLIKLYAKVCPEVLTDQSIEAAVKEPELQAEVSLLLKLRGWK